MRTEPIQIYILKNERNLRIASAVGEVWLETRGKLVSDFLERLDSRLKRTLKGWDSTQEGEVFFIEGYPGYNIWKPAWNNQYSIRLECHEHGERIIFGVEHDSDHLGRRPHSAELLAAVKKVFPSAVKHRWWEARMPMRSPAPDWRKPEVLWRIHKDGKFLDEVAQQLLQVVEISEPIIDRLARRK